MVDVSGAVGTVVPVGTVGVVDGKFPTGSPDGLTAPLPLPATAVGTAIAVPIPKPPTSQPAPFFLFTSSTAGVNSIFAACS